MSVKPTVLSENVNVPSFIAKTYEIFNTENIEDCCGW